MDWNDIKQRIQEDDHDKWDLPVKGFDLKLASYGALLLRQNGTVKPYRLTDWALRQLCQRLSIPTGYFKRLPGEMQAELANYDLTREADAGYLIRGKGTAIRAVLSDRYVPYNNRQVSEAVEATVAGNGLAVRSFMLEDVGMFLKLTSKALTDRDLELKAGAMIGNSEVGFAQVTVEPFLYRRPCTNDLIVAEQAAFRHRHLGFTAEGFSERIAEAVSEALRLAETAVSAAHTADQQPVKNPEREIKQLAAGWKLQVRLVAAILDAYQVEPRPTRFGLANSFTRAAQRLPAMERIEVERLAGRLLAMQA